MAGGMLRIAIFSSILASSAALTARTWTTRLGRTFDAEFVRMDGENVIFVLPNGRAFSSPLADLDAKDQMVLTGGQTNPAAVVSANFGKPWPREVRLDGPSACKVISETSKTRRFIYESPGYRFTCDARVTEDALRNFSVMFEATRKYARALPLSLGGVERQGKMDILLFGNQNEYITAGGMPGSAGVFRKGVVMVPMESLGLKEGGTGFSLDTNRRNFVLIHELAHQLTPTVYFVPGALGWFSEGLAEYIAITPYNWGYFSPDIHGNVVKSYVTTRGTNELPGRSLGTDIVSPKIKTLFLMPYSQFSGANANSHYGLGLLVTHYFFHIEGGGRALRITEYLKGLHAGQQGEKALTPLLGGGTYEKLEEEITAAWERMGVRIRFGG